MEKPQSWVTAIMETAQFLQSLVQSALFSQYGFQTKSKEAIFKATCLKKTIEKDKEQL